MGRVGPLGFSLLGSGVVDEVLMVSGSRAELLVSSELILHVHGGYTSNSLGFMFLA